MGSLLRKCKATCLILLTAQGFSCAFQLLINDVTSALWGFCWVDCVGGCGLVIVTFFCLSCWCGIYCYDIFCLSGLLNIDHVVGRWGSV
jgi:hypothetical protein